MKNKTHIKLMMNFSVTSKKAKRSMDYQKIMREKKTQQHCKKHLKIT